MLSFQARRFGSEAAGHILYSLFALLDSKLAVALRVDSLCDFIPVLNNFESFF